MYTFYTICLLNSDLRGWIIKMKIIRRNVNTNQSNKIEMTQIPIAQLNQFRAELQWKILRWFLRHRLLRRFRLVKGYQKMQFAQQQQILSTIAQSWGSGQGNRAFRASELILPTFDGTFVKYRPFKDLFLSLINRSYQTPVEKQIDGCSGWSHRSSDSLAEVHFTEKDD